MRRPIHLAIALSAAVALASCDAGPTGPDNALAPGQTDFVNTEPGSSPGYGGAPGADAGAAAAPGAPDRSSGKEGAPSGRTGTVEEADIYRVSQNRLFYLNTYRGFLIYDLADTKKPRLVSRLPVFGVPIEMYVQKNTVFVLLKDALYLTQERGQLTFKRHNTSQLVAIDVSDIRRPRVLKTIDIRGLLREGVSRKIDDTIYVVSYQPQSYYYGFRAGGPVPKEQAWVYSFNVKNPSAPRLVEKLRIFEGGSYSFRDPVTGSNGSKRFRSVAISATANALMVVENWDYRGYARSGPYSRCGSYLYTQQAVVSIVDISDPTGDIKLHTRFETWGQLTDQFKHTYIYDSTTKKGTYLGIFARREWQSADCRGTSFTQNRMEAWDVTNGKSPRLVSAVAFGKKNETVRGSAFDLKRKVAYAITARQIDPLYVIGFADVKNLKILSQIDGLSGDMNVFRLLGNGDFLMGIGRDTSASCTGFDTGRRWFRSGVAVSIIDVKSLSKIRLVQRACVSVDARWVSSAVNTNRDQAHKMIGMLSDGRVNLVTVPVYYWKRSTSSGWWWSQMETAVGVLGYDLKKYDPTRSHLDQKVLEDYGTIVHPYGRVRRSIMFTHKGATDRRMLINISDTHISIVDIDDLSRAVPQSVIEVAPYYSQIYRFGGYLVEHITPGATSYYYGNPQKSEFRVKLATGVVEDAKPLATFTVGQVQRVVKHGSKLVLFRRVLVPRTSGGRTYYTYGNTEALIYDLSDPRSPKRLATIALGANLLPYYRYYCGVGAYWGGYYFSGSGSNWTVTRNGIAFVQQGWDYTTRSYSRRMVYLDLARPASPRVVQIPLTADRSWAFYGVVADPIDTTQLFLSYRVQVGTSRIGRYTFGLYRYYAQPWRERRGTLAAGGAINMPGRLTRTFTGTSSRRLFLTQDYSYYPVTSGSYTYWRPRFRLNLLREVSLRGRAAAQLLDSRPFGDDYLRDLVQDGPRLYLNATRRSYVTSATGYRYSTSAAHLRIIDLSRERLDERYDRPTGTSSIELMGTYKGKLFMNLPGDGVVVVDATNPARPVGLNFARTLGRATHIAFAGDTAYIASGHFGLYQLRLSMAPAIAWE